MNIILSLFFISLSGILVMVGRKLAIIQNGEILTKEYPHPFVSDLQKIKSITLIAINRYGYMSIVLLIRLQIKSTNFLKNKYKEIKNNIKNKIHQNQNGDTTGDVKEVSNFLKTISDYKKKLKNIKDRISNEEENL